MATIIPRELVAEHFAVPPALLLRYEAHGLIRPLREDHVEGYGPAEIRRLWTVLTLHRDLGVNLAGIEAILRLRAQLDAVHTRLAALARELHEVLEADRAPDDR